jgi:protein-L-isoaspartate(D-aspartate) O-methyltransferase
MTEALDVRAGDRVLEVGTGSGYQTAILSAMGARVHTIERHAALADAARRRLDELGYGGIQWKVGDGSEGWPEFAPFDRIMVTAGAPSVPVALASQMAEGGRMVIPIGPLDRQDLVLYVREGGMISRRTLCEVVFVKLVGREGWENP